MNIRKISFASTAILVYGLTSCAYAVGQGFYMGVQLGQTNTHNEARAVHTGVSVPPTPAPTVEATPSNTGFGGGVFLGYNFNPYVAVEGGYTHYGQSSYKPSVVAPGTNPSPAIQTNGGNVVLKGILPFETTGFAVFGKAGLAVIRQSLAGKLTTASDGSIGGGSTTTNLHGTAGIGFSYDLTQSWVADLSFTRVFKSGGVNSADLAALGFSYHFTDRYCGQFLC